MAYLNPNLSYPKRRSTMQLVIPVFRGDSGTPKAWLPKDAVISGVHVYQFAAAVTANATFTVGLGSDADGILETFTMSTTKVGLVNAGASAGVEVLAKQTTDKPITVTFAAGSSTAGGQGYVVIDFFIAGPGEAVDD
jgi:hypothetical protein